MDAAVQQLQALAWNTSSDTGDDTQVTPYPIGHIEPLQSILRRSLQQILVEPALLWQLERT